MRAHKLGRKPIYGYFFDSVHESHISPWLCRFKVLRTMLWGKGPM